MQTYRIYSRLHTSLISLTLLALGAWLLQACSGKVSEDFLSSAVIETQIYQIGTTAQGKIIALYKQEGQMAQAQELVALVDTLPLFLQLAELQAGLGEIDANTAAKQDEIQAGASDLKGLEKDYNRAAPLIQEGALPGQQEDKFNTSLNSSRNRLAANKSVQQSLRSKKAGLEAKLAQLKDQIHRCYIYAPVTGRILTRYKNLGEVAALGQPLFEMGREDTLQVDFFIPQPYLSGIHYGQVIRLRLDQEKGGELFMPATVTWISNEAEFSPKNIQTRDSRNELVFKIRAVVANKDGLLKRGLPVEIWK